MQVARKAEFIKESGDYRGCDPNDWSNPSFAENGRRTDKPLLTCANAQPLLDLKADMRDVAQVRQSLSSPDSPRDEFAVK